MLVDAIVWASFFQGMMILFFGLIGYMLFGTTKQGGIYGYFLFTIIAIVVSIILLPGLLA